MGSFVCKSAFVSLWIVSLCKIDYLFQFIITICIQIFFFLRTFISLTYSMVSHIYYFDREGKNAGTHVHEGAHGLIHGVVHICLGFSCVRLGSCLISYLLFNWTRSRAHTLRLTHCVLHTAAKLVRTKFCFPLFSLLSHDSPICWCYCHWMFLALFFIFRFTLGSQSS